LGRHRNRHRGSVPRRHHPALKRAVREQQNLFNASVVLIEDKASGTQLIQELIAEGCHGSLF
jgi:phage terminase large subunit-like protein